MALPLTYPGVYIEEVPSGVRTITGVATSIALFIGWAFRWTLASDLLHVRQQCRSPLMNC